MACIRQPGCFPARNQRSPLQDSRLVSPISDIAQRLSVRKLERPPRLSVVTLATLGPRPRLSLGLAKVLFLQQRGQGEGGFGVGLLLTVDLLGRPGGSEEVGSEDGVDMVVCEGLTECGGLLRSFEREGEGEVASARWYHLHRNAEEGRTFIPVVAGGRRTNKHGRLASLTTSLKSAPNHHG